MPGWDIDEEESVSWEDKDDVIRRGADYYMLVVHYKGMKANNFVPHHEMFDSDGVRIVNTYNKAQTRTEEGDPESVFNKKTVKWTTKSDVLNQLQPATKQCCNSLKAWLNKSAVALWYHNANVDECAMYGGPHVHIVYESERTSSGGYRSLHDNAGYRGIRKKIDEVGGYIKSQAIRNLDAACRHFLQSPRMYMGTNTISLNRAIAGARAPRTIMDPVVSMKDIFDDENVDVVDASTEKSVAKYSGWESDEPVVKKCRSGWDDSSFTIPATNNTVVAIKETDSDRYGRLLKMLMIRWSAFTVSEMFNAIGKLSEGVELKYKQLWYRLAAKPRTKMLLSVQHEMLKSEYICKPFAELINIYAHQTVPCIDETMSTPEDSYSNWISWCNNQQYDVHELIRDIFDIIDRKILKVNTLCMIGDSNSGKTCMISNPLKALCRFVGQIGNRGSNSEFVYQECINQRLIVIDECMMSKEQLEDLKNLTGGEDMSVNVKFAGNAKLSRTPVILTGNKEPWLLDFSAKEPLLNRMKYYTSHKDEDLKDCKVMHPGMWWYLMQIKDLTTTPDPTTLISYPTIDDPEAIDCNALNV